jgi:hypothetical protein
MKGVILINTLEATVTEILSDPIKKNCADHSWWEVKIKYTVYGKEHKGTEVFEFLDLAQDLRVGDKIWR